MRGSVWLTAATALVVVAWTGSAHAGGAIRLRLDTKPEQVAVPEADPAKGNSDVVQLAMRSDKVRGDANIMTLAISGNQDDDDTQLVRGWGGYRGGWGGYRGYGWGGYRSYGWGGYRGYGWGGYGYRGYGWGGYRGYGWGGYYRPYWGYGWGGYYRPYWGWGGYYSYGYPYYSYGYPYYYYPSYSYYYYPTALSYDPSALSYYYNNSTESPATDLNIRPRTLTPAPADGTYPYDGGPKNPVPMPQPKSDPTPMKRPQPTVPLEGKVVSLTPAPSPVKYTYPAYGESSPPYAIKLKIQTAEKR